MASINNLIPTSPLYPDNVNIIDQNFTNINTELVGKANLSGATFTGAVSATNLNGTNTGDVTLAGTPNYITIVGQVITRTLINLTSHITGILPVANGGTGSSTQNFVDLTTAQTKAGVLTFSSSPIVPTPTTDFEVATKKYVDDNAGGGGPTKLRITIPGELITDTSNYQGLYFKNESGVSWTISNVAIAVGINASGTGAACAVNLYKSSGTEADGINTNAVNLFTTAVDLGATYSNLTNVPNIITVENGRWLSLKITSSAGATRRASDMQVIITLT